MSAGVQSLSVLENYFTYCRYQKNLDQKTLKAYKIDLQQFLSWTQFEIEVSRATMEQYIELLVRKYKISTVKRKIAAIKAFYHYLAYEEIIASTPLDKIQLHFRQEVLLPRTIENSVLTKIFSAAYREKEQAATIAEKGYTVRDIAVLELLFASGVRVSELCSITCDALDLQSQVVLIKGKGSKERRIYLATPQVVAALVEYGALRKRIGTNVPFFP